MPGKDSLQAYVFLRLDGCVKRQFDDNEGNAWGYTFGKRYTDRFGGTSAATAIVSGVAALVLSANPSLKAYDVKNILRDTADSVVHPVNPQQWMGYGKVNAAKAVASAAALRKTRN